MPCAAVPHFLAIVERRAKRKLKKFRTQKSLACVFCSTSNERLSHLLSLRRLMTEMNGQGILIHFEGATFVEPDMIGVLASHVIPHVDSLGMNEQELPNLLSFLRNGKITMLSDAYPHVSHVLGQMRALYRLLYSRHGRVSRLHVHTVAFQAIMTRQSAPWRNTMAAAAHASLTAHRFVSGQYEVDLNRTKILLDNSLSSAVASIGKLAARHGPVSCWEEDVTGNGHLVTICVVPTLVSTRVYQTAGAGDNISAAGLVYQI